MIGRVGFSISITNPWARGIIFTLFGLASLVAEIILIYHEISVDDFLWVNVPATSIFFLVFWLLGTIAFFAAGIYFFKEALMQNPKTVRPPKPPRNPNFGMGLIFFIIGLISAVIPVVLVLDRDGSHPTSQYVLIFILCFAFAAPFLALGTIWMKPPKE
ncbi:MAG: hypothetical protein IJ911_12755 [Salinivirgaceae bacterium]|nr:hypothetical protein [Salinivirgaceae bacterium]